MGRSSIDIDVELLQEKLNELPTQEDVADFFNCSQGTISNKVRELGIVKSNGKTDRDNKIEFPHYTWQQAVDTLIDIQDNNSPTVGYEEVEIEIEAPKAILIIPIQDLHIGSRYTYSRELISAIDLIVDNPRVFTSINGDLADNYNTSAYKAGQIEQKLPIQHQKGIVEALMRKLQGNILWFVNGCHDEWSYLNDGFDLAQYLSHKDREGYYMGHHGTVYIYLNGIKYKIFTTHNTFNNSQLNKGHGLKWICREHVGYDIGVKAHDHTANVEEFVMRGKNRYAMCGSSFKGQDRHGSKTGFYKSGKTTPGFILNAKEKQIFMDLDYRNLVKYL